MKLQQLNLYSLYLGAVIATQSYSLKRASLFMITSIYGEPLDLPQIRALRLLAHHDDPDCFTITHFETKLASFSKTQFSSFFEPVRLQRETYFSTLAPIEINQILSAHLNQDVQLRWIAAPPLYSNAIKNKVLSKLSAARLYLLLNRTSFEHIKKRQPFALSLMDLEPDFVFQSRFPFCEDQFKKIKINDVVFECIAPFCWDQKSTDRDFLNAIQADSPAYFGIILKPEITENAVDPVLFATDRIQLLEKKSSQIARKIRFTAQDSMPNDGDKCIQIQLDAHSFSGNTRQPLLEQLEQAGFMPPSSCRTGYCGKCRLKLDSGEVLFLRAFRFNETQRLILPCMSIPKSDVKLSSFPTKNGKNKRID